MRFLLALATLAPTALALALPTAAPTTTAVHSIPTPLAFLASQVSQYASAHPKATPTSKPASASHSKSKTAPAHPKITQAQFPYDPHCPGGWYVADQDRSGHLHVACKGKVLPDAIVAPFSKHYYSVPMG
ncbi:hypothetical protein G7Y79_00026g058460 [Physcia stellaris]|nr:hypothetical protein G7Y79_00026g058460 [Physcia stellaris]